MSVLRYITYITFSELPFEVGIIISISLLLQLGKLGPGEVK